jgi:hypothetical protein
MSAWAKYLMTWRGSWSNSGCWGDLHSWISRCREKEGRFTRKDGNGAVSGRISAGFGSSRFGFGLDFSPTVFGFGAPKLIGFGFGSGFSSVDIQWITDKSLWIKIHVLLYTNNTFLLIYYFKLSHGVIYYFVTSYLYMWICIYTCICL